MIIAIKIGKARPKVICIQRKDLENAEKRFNPDNARLRKVGFGMKEWQIRIGKDFCTKYISENAPVSKACERCPLKFLAKKRSGDVGCIVLLSALGFENNQWLSIDELTGYVGWCKDYDKQARKNVAKVHTFIKQALDGQTFFQI